MSDAGLLPNLLVIGVQKGGTTWLHDRLRHHPDIFMSETKETHFFNRARPDAHLAAYRRHFVEAGDRRWRGESTPGYFWTWDASPDASNPGYPHRNRAVAASARRALGPDTRVLLSLRHPVLRAISALAHHFRRGRIDPDAPFATVVEGYGIAAMGEYRRHYRVWAKSFPRTIRTVFLDDIARDGQAVLDDVFAWLGVPPVTIPGAATPIHLGLPLVRHGDAVEIDLVASAAERQTLPARSPRITQADLDALQARFADDIAWVERKFDAARLGWSRPLMLDDLVRR